MMQDVDQAGSRELLKEAVGGEGRHVPPSWEDGSHDGSKTLIQ